MACVVRAPPHLLLPPAARSKHSFPLSIALQAAAPLSRRNNHICHYQVGRWDRAACQPTSAGSQLGVVREGSSTWGGMLNWTGPELIRRSEAVQCSVHPSQSIISALVTKGKVLQNEGLTVS